MMYKSSFGVELEFLVAVGLETEQYSTQEGYETGHRRGQPVFIPESQCAYDGVDLCCYKTIQSTIEQHLGIVNPATRVLPPGQPVTDDYESLEGYSKWTVKPDYSIMLPENHGILGKFRGYHWVCVEVTSPALWAAPESFKEVKKVCELLRTNFLTLITDSCGLHIHWGRGSGWVPVHHLRQAAALLLACDPLLAQLHPESRKDNYHCLSNRYFSEVAQRTLTAEQVNESLDEEALEPLAFGQRGGRGTEYAGSSRVFSRRIAAGCLEWYPFKPHQVPVSVEKFHTSLRAPQSTPNTARQLPICSLPEAVGRLMNSSSKISARKLAFNFRNYIPGFYGESDVKRTIEFRQCAGTLDGEEVAAFAKLFIGLCEFSEKTTINDLWHLILKCAEAEVAAAEWPDVTGDDVFDILIEAGLAQEAEALQTVTLKRQSKSKVSRDELAQF
ncbi:hypothetical protein INS49_013181 [Diaporthe citri]|uniref:uncharacterized protein n=1 Tax=Diaporthe citri TaxID=83186 RepID=UPI001C7E875C|nr:uncharacterized protein INS49_013181 [Diaporthe citri]KAG6359658.1 hypothetical protein INS49_013181 [Diaporthe citri]